MANTTIRIRPRRDSDLAECSAVLRAVHAISGYPVNGVGDPVSFLRTDDQAWVAVQVRGGGDTSEKSNDDGNGNGNGNGSNETVVGHAALARASEHDVAAALWWKQQSGEEEDDDDGNKDNILVLGRLFVHPEARGGGVATRLIDGAMAEARERGARLVMLALVKDQAAIRLYRRLGWVHYGNTVFGWGEGRQMEGECFVSPPFPGHN